MVSLCCAGMWTNGPTKRQKDKQKDRQIDEQLVGQHLAITTTQLQYLTRNI